MENRSSVPDGIGYSKPDPSPAKGWWSWSAPCPPRSTGTPASSPRRTVRHSITAGPPFAAKEPLEPERGAGEQSVIVSPFLDCNRGDPALPLTFERHLDAFYPGFCSWRHQHLERLRPEITAISEPVYATLMLFALPGEGWWLGRSRFTGRRDTLKQSQQFQKVALPV